MAPGNPCLMLPMVISPANTDPKTINAAARGMPLVSSRPRQYATITQMDTTKYETKTSMAVALAPFPGRYYTDDIADGDEIELERGKWCPTT